MSEKLENDNERLRRRLKDMREEKKEYQETSMILHSIILVLMLMVSFFRLNTLRLSSKNRHLEKSLNQCNYLVNKYDLVEKERQEIRELIGIY